MERLHNLTISLLSEYLYCPRSFIYRFYDYKPMENENLYIADGRLTHVKSDSQDDIYDRYGRRVIPRYYIYSKNLCISGIVDRVIFEKNNKILAIEEKRGRLRYNNQIEMQLALEVYCLNEMFPGCEISGSIYFSESRRHKKVEVKFEEVEKFVISIQEKLKNGLETFPKTVDIRCTGCMFEKICGVT